MARFRILAATAVAVVVVAGAAAGGRSQSGDWRGIQVEGVSVRVPRDWRRVDPADPGPVTDPVTVLVVGTRGVRAKPSACQIASYTIPPAAAAVVIVEWRQLTVTAPASRRELRTMRVRPRAFECGGRGAAAVVRLHGRPFQVNVLVGPRATKRRVADALLVAKSIAARPRQR